MINLTDRELLDLSKEALAESFAEGIHPGVSIGQGPAKIVIPLAFIKHFVDLLNKR